MRALSSYFKSENSRKVIMLRITFNIDLEAPSKNALPSASNGKQTSIQRYPTHVHSDLKNCSKLSLNHVNFNIMNS